ncbi:amidase family protein [Sphingobium sp. AN558]|uniref:amidase family protein n=1 Tax=Sphingobium sp. AN558 TaxID=3133442 RepID=UPI0030C4C9E4
MTDTATATLSSRTPPSEDADFAALGLAAAARAIRNGDITSQAYTTALLARARAEADLNAFISIDEAEVLAAARDADKARAAGSSSPLLGVPLGIKDSYLTKGLPTSLGLEPLARFIPREDADAVRAIKEAGALVLGKNNLVEMSFGLTGHNAGYGQVKNPVSRDRVSGGSSSGSAASVAAGIVPASLGGDTIGSIRVPASLCGVVGFKPTTGRWPRGGVAPISHTLDTTGVIARSVEDCALVDQIVTGEPGSEHSATADGLKGVRLVYAPRQFLDLIEPDVEARFRDVVMQLRSAGADVAEVDLGDDFGALSQTATWSIFFHETMGAVSEFLRHHDVPLSFEEVVANLKPELQGAWRYMVMPDGGGATSAETYQTALTVSRPEIQRRLDAGFAEHGAQAILQPTTPCTAPLIDQQAKFLIGEREASDLVLANHTLVASLLGLPGISLPMGLSGNGLPIGLELDGPLRDDRALLELARRIEGLLVGQVN